MAPACARGNLAAADVDVELGAHFGDADADCSGLESGDLGAFGGGVVVGEGWSTARSSGNGLGCHTRCGQFFILNSSLDRCLPDAGQIGT